MGHSEAYSKVYDSQNTAGRQATKLATMLGATANHQ